MNTSSGQSAAEHTGRTHVGPQKNDSLWYKAKVISPIAGLLLLVITVTWAFTSYDKRITVLEVGSAEQVKVDEAQDTQIRKNTDDIGGFKAWAPAIDFKVSLLLDHFGIKVPNAKK
jgi:hypothetical protein